MYNEVPFLLREELKEPRIYFSILNAISIGKTILSEIINHTGYEEGIITKYLSVLSDLKLVKRQIPVTENVKSRKGIYVIEDNFFVFWFKYVFNNMRNLGDEIEFKENGIIQKRAQGVLKEAAVMLKNIENEGLMETIEAGKFAGVKRAKTGGKGLDGVVVKDEMYFNPFIELMLGGEYRD